MTFINIKWYYQSVSVKETYKVIRKRVEKIEYCIESLGKEFQEVVGMGIHGNDTEELYLGSILLDSLFRMVLMNFQDPILVGSLSTSQI